MRNPLILAVALAACGKPSKSPAPKPVEPPPETAGSAEPAKAPPPAAAPAVVDATPDVPSGADAARDAELAKAATGVIDAFINSEPVFTRDAKHVVFVSNRDGLPQLYLGDVSKPDAPATRLVTSTERMTGAVPTP